jgi:hypothetical protein
MLNDPIRSVVEAARYSTAVAIAKEMNLDIQRGLSPDGVEQLLTITGNPDQIAACATVLIEIGFVRFIVIGVTKEETDFVCAQANGAMTRVVQFFTENQPQAEPAPAPTPDAVVEPTIAEKLAEPAP